jgi:uncharacterized membrane protein
MLIGLHWVYFVAAGAVLNVFVNLGFKYFSSKPEAFFLSACAYVFTALTMIVFGLLQKTIRPEVLLEDKTMLVVAGTGIALGVAIISFVTALAKGPFGLVNATWLSSMIVMAMLFGLLFFKEQISWQAGVGVLLTLIGIAFMAKG